MNNISDNNDWTECCLSDIALINPRETIKKGSTSKSVAMEKLVPYCRKIDGFELKAFKGGTKFRNQDTLLARITPCLENGKTAYVDILEDGEIGFGSTEYIVIRPKEGLSDSKFLYYFSISPRFREEAIKLMTGTSGRQRVQTDQIVSKIFAFPKLPEQKAIAAILTSFDDKIELLRQQNQTLEDVAQTLFKEWFVDYRFPGASEMVDSELGMIPERWKIGKLEELIEIKYGKDHKHLDNGEIPVYGSGGIMRYANKSLYSDQSILIPRKGTLSNLFYINTPFWTVDTMFYSKIRKKEFGKFCFLLLKTLNLSSMDVGSAVPSLTTHLLNGIKIIIPDDKIMKTFDDVVSTIFKKKEFNETQIQTLTQLRDRLLPKLMSGEVRVSNFNKTKDEHLN